MLDLSRLEATALRLDALAKRAKAIPTRRERMLRRLEARLDAEFHEEDHPRGEDGKFGSGGGSATKNIMKPLTADTKPPEHIAKLRIPPAWKDVKYSDDPKAPLQVIGRDEKGRVQSIYSADHTTRQAVAKFNRVESLRKEYYQIHADNAKLQKSDKPKVKAAADVMALVMAMGLRPGSDRETGGKVKAYGATNLEGRHVVEEDGQVRLRFQGKHGVNIDLPVEDRSLAEMLKTRASGAGENGKLFDGVTENDLLNHAKSLGNGSFKTKDFRTRVGTETAWKAVESAKPPKNEKEYKKAIMEVAKQVAARLGNTPVVALQSYIAPQVFMEWREGLNA